VIDPARDRRPDRAIAEDVEIGPFAVVGASVEIGAGCWIGPHAS
jgi:UDP-N-acetylglucosamine acyltransferase